MTPFYIFVDFKQFHATFANVPQLLKKCHNHIDTADKKDFSRKIFSLTLFTLVQEGISWAWGRVAPFTRGWLVMVEA